MQLDVEYFVFDWRKPSLWCRIRKIRFIAIIIRTIHQVKLEEFLVFVYFEVLLIIRTSICDQSQAEESVLFLTESILESYRNPKRLNLFLQTPRD